MIAAEKSILKKAVTIGCEDASRTSMLDAEATSTPIAKNIYILSIGGCLVVLHMVSPDYENVTEYI